MSFIMLLIIGYSLVVTTNIVKISISVSFTLINIYYGVIHKRKSRPFEKGGSIISGLFV